MATVEPCAPHKARSPAPNAPGHAHCQLWGVGLPRAPRRPCAEGRGASASGAGRCRPLPPAPSLFAWSAAATTTRHTIAPVTKQPARAPPTSCFHSSRWQSSAPTSRSHLTPSAACASGAHTHTTGTAGHTQPPKPDGPGGCPLGGHKRAKAGAGSEGHGNTSAKGESRARQGCSRGRPTPAARGPLPAAPLLPSAPFPFPPAGPQDATRRPPDAGRPSAPSGGAGRGAGRVPLPSAEVACRGLPRHRAPRNPLGSPLSWDGGGGGRLADPPLKRLCVAVPPGAGGGRGSWAQAEAQAAYRATWVGPPGGREPCHMTRGHNSVSGECRAPSAGP